MVEDHLDMNEISIDITKFPADVQDGLKNKALREGKTLSQVMVEMVKKTTETILGASGEVAE